MSIVWWVLQGLLDESVSEYCVVDVAGSVRRVSE